MAEGNDKRGRHARCFGGLLPDQPIWERLGQATASHFARKERRMTLGRSWYQRQPRAFLNDTNLVTAYLTRNDEGDLVPKGNIASALFTIIAPSDDPTLPSISAVAGQVVDDGKAEYLAPASLHTEAGQYRGRAVFHFDDEGHTHTRTVPIEYEIADPLGLADAAVYGPAVDLAWSYFADIFDSEEGGPWLRDMSMNYFDRERIHKFIPDVILEINVAQPMTAYSDTDFPFADATANALFALGLTLATIRHLKRSYVEQPLPANSAAAFHDRQQYLERWTAIEASEKERYEKLLTAWKMGHFDITRAAMLVSSKAGRLYPGFMRTRGRPMGF